MAGHDTTLVPLEAWAYASPSLKVGGKSVDVGLLAESLIYYDCVYANPANATDLAELISWIASSGGIDNLYRLLEEGALKFYDYSFMTSVIEKEGVYSLWNIQDQIQQKENTFEQRFLYHPSVEQLVPKSRHRRRLYSAFKENVIEVKSSSFSNAIENARQDFTDPRRIALVVQAFTNEVYRYRHLGRPPKVQAQVSSSEDAEKHHLTWNIDFNELSNLAGTELNFHNGTPLTASAHSNRLIWSAAMMGCDLFLPSPMSALVGDKLYESTHRATKLENTIAELKAQVEFPDIRSLVNEGKIGLSDILKIRKKAKRFRSWLQQGSERDRNAIIAYHNEVARETGFSKAARKAVSLFGVVGGGAAGSAIGASMGGPVGGAIGGAAGSSIGYLAEIASKIGSNWRPVVFGDWLKDRIQEHMERN